MNFYEVIKTEIRSLSFECQSKIQRVFAFEPVPSLKAVPRALSHFTIIILGVKLSNGWNREVLHIVKIWCLLCKSYCPFEYERGSEEAEQEKGVPFISQSTRRRHLGKAFQEMSPKKFAKSADAQSIHPVLLNIVKSVISLKWRDCSVLQVLALHYKLKSFVHISLPILLISKYQVRQTQ